MTTPTNGAAPQLLKCCPVREVAKGLLGLGVKAGTMVLIYSPTCYQWGVADFACAAMGAVVVPVYETDSAPSDRGGSSRK